MASGQRTAASELPGTDRGLVVTVASKTRYRWRQSDTVQLGAPGKTDF